MVNFKLTTTAGINLSAKGATDEHLSTVLKGIFPDTSQEATKGNCPETPLNARQGEGKPRTNVGKGAPVEGSAHTGTTTLQKEYTSKHTPNNGNIRTDRAGVLTYFSEYDCPNCGDQGHRFIWASSDYMKCLKCACQMKVEPTMPPQTNGVPLPAKDGVFFSASKFYDPLYEKGK